MNKSKIIHQLKNYKIIICVIAAYCLISFGFTIHFASLQDTTIEQDGIFDTFNFKMTGIILMFIFITLVIRVMVIERPKRLTLHIIHKLRSEWLRPAFLLRGGLMMACLYIFVFAFTNMKAMIPLFNSYGEWDSLFYELDKTIHFGMSPWQITHGIFSFPVLTFLINISYNLWFFVLYAVFILQAFIYEDERTRKTYFLSFFLCWIINGTLLATLFSSVGPCYYDLLYSLENGPYSGLMSRLNTINETYPIWALETQDLLWNNYANEEKFLGSGISAMPSLHVSIALMQVFLGYRVGKIYGRMLLAFFIMIFIGSVHLGWHYAIDGYLSIITTTGIWFFSSWVAKKTTKDLPLTNP